MARLSATTVSLSNGDITIDAEALAPKLGLSVEALRENMAKASSRASPRPASTRTRGASASPFATAHGSGAWSWKPTGRSPKPPYRASNRSP